MKTLYKFLIAGCLLTTIAGCKKNWLERTPQTIILEDQVWNDPKQILGLLANYYDRLPTDMGVDGNWRNMADYDDAMWSGYTGEDGRNNIISYAYSRWAYWDYTLIRDINLALESIEKYSVKLTDVQKKQFSGELRFIRAYVYFELVKRMGGVPLVTKQLIYDFSGDPSSLQQPRVKESDIYDFISSEMDAIREDLKNVDDKGTPSNSRANKFTALALKSRALLYAASIAKYNNLMASPISLPGGEVGIPASKATEYYTKSLEASKEIITSGAFALYKGNPANLGENFYEAVVRKSSNKEAIFVRDFLSAKNKRHAFSYDNIPLGIREDNLSSSCITPSLNLVESYEYLDGSNGALKTNLPDNSDFIYYNSPEDIFANKDARLYGTVILPGTSFKGRSVQIQAGVMKWNGTAYQTIEGSQLGATYSPPAFPDGDGKLLTGSSGPHRSIQEVTNSGFYLRKFVDAGAGTSTRGILSDTWWVWFRLGEIYLNAAEAAFELDQKVDAATWISALRERAGFAPNSVTSATITMDRIRNERRVELAFEDHRVWDLKRWRIADQVWNGQPNNPNATVYALYPYRIIRPGDAARDGKYVFVKLTAPRFRAPRFFQLGNYYSAIDQGIINNNPKIVRNPFH
ncbi:RagB/SusD family nutrient uptake outer membrane protein [Paraflavitalea soli]|uniref:RagB/SusD family nutrient uptake outer membrane protein n=1 Tax=Paraflavitalea soli TaxID=2315862 RepID=A0A3B7MH94_9BACT|nr:RagB/SusD family nutrient uptake outer membrane protein [Paraflavitalea soli]AXY72519.1 RagB/SusD family nutrient uptake outer membrane protein [Paraflavitalea soli]